MVGAWVLAAILAGYATMCPAALRTAAVPLDRRDVVVRLVTEFLAGDNEVRAPFSHFFIEKKIPFIMDVDRYAQQT
jgi:hypothetical protein